MQVKIKCLVFKAKEGKDKTYLQAIDLEEGGLIDFSVPNTENVNVGDELTFTAKATSGKGKYGLYLSFDDVKLS